MIDVIGKKIKEQREKQNMTQKELAQKLNRNRETINQWENGARDLKTEDIVALAHCLNTSTDYLLGLTLVTTTDTTIQDISKVTGLNEKSINTLNLLKKEVSIFSVKESEDEIRQKLFNDTPKFSELNLQTIESAYINNAHSMTLLDTLNFLIGELSEKGLVTLNYIDKYMNNTFGEKLIIEENGYTNVMDEEISSDMLLQIYLLKLNQELHKAREKYQLEKGGGIND